MRTRYVCLAAIVLLTLTIQVSAQDVSQAQRDHRAWHFLSEELAIQKLVWDLAKLHRPQNFAVTNVNVIPMTSQEVLPDMTVVVTNGKIETVGSSSAVRIPKNYRVIDATGRYLMPGLTEMHSHNLVTSSQHLLHIANGVTSVRDMCGFPWMLKLKKQIADNRLLAPNFYVAGHILNARPMGMYATVVKSPEHARTIVQEQKAKGYEFIKVHNSLPPDIYQAIADEAQKVNLDVVGHIPHDVQVAQAIRAGQRTLEHFKGYIQDSTLTLTSEDYVKATKDASVWNCPTFYTYREHMRGEAAKKLVRDDPQMKYVSWREKEEWLAAADEVEDAKLLAARQNILALSKKIFRDLLPMHAQFLAGTDSGGGYAYMVPGFALHEEMQIMNEQGLSAYETLKAATVNAATAMRKEAEFGTIQRGKRADLLLLDSNPLQDIRHLSGIHGVSLRGIWLSRADLDGILKKIEEIYNPPIAERVIPNLSQDQKRQLARDYVSLHSRGMIFRTHDLELLQKLLDKAQLTDEAAEVAQSAASSRY